MAKYLLFHGAAKRRLPSFLRCIPAPKRQSRFRIRPVPERTVAAALSDRPFSASAGSAFSGAEIGRKSCDFVLSFPSQHHQRPGNPPFPFHHGQSFSSHSDRWHLHGFFHSGRQPADAYSLSQPEPVPQSSGLSLQTGFCRGTSLRTLGKRLRLRPLSGLSPAG